MSRSRPEPIGSGGRTTRDGRTKPSRYAPTTSNRAQCTLRAGSPRGSFRPANPIGPTMSRVSLPLPPPPPPPRLPSPHAPPHPPRPRRRPGWHSGPRPQAVALEGPLFCRIREADQPSLRHRWRRLGHRRPRHQNVQDSAAGTASPPRTATHIARPASSRRRATCPHRPAGAFRQRHQREGRFHVDGRLP